MNWLRRLFGPSNGLLFLYDDLTNEAADVLEAEITETKRYYRFVTVTELAAALREGKPEGLAAVAFRQPRRSVLLRAIPFLRAENIPATLYVIADSVGTNRLSSVEELEIYFAAYPNAFEGKSLAGYKERAWNDPVGTETMLKEWRATVGPLPLDTLEPTRYSSTWGKILEIPPELREIGLHLTSRWDSVTTRDDIEFVGRQAGKPVTSLYSPKGKVAQAEGMAVVVEEKGTIERATDPMAMPVWNL